MSCSTGLISTVNKILNNKPWFKFNSETGYIKILESPKNRINSYTIPGVAGSTATSINKAITKEYPQIGQIAYFTYIDGVAGVVVSPTNRQLDILNQANRAEEASIRADLELEQQLRDFEERQLEGNWIEKDGEIVSQDDINFQPSVDFALKAVTNIQNNLPKVNQWFKQIGNTDKFWNKIQQDLQIPKNQVSLLRESDGNTIEEKLVSFTANYSYTIEINTATKNEIGVKERYNPETGEIDIDNIEPDIDYIEEYDEEGNIIGMKPVLSEKGKSQLEETPTQHYSNLTVPGGTNYTENEIATPAITPSIKGHAQFSTDNGIGWFRSDEQVSSRTEDFEEFYEQEYLGHEYPPEIRVINHRNYIGEEYGSKTRRILEVQSDLFQKGRGLDDLVTKQSKNSLDNFSTLMSNLNRKLDKGEISLENYRKERQILENNQKLGEKFRNLPDNQFLQLLNKDSNWVTFFIKSIIQDSAKKGYEKVLFPTGNTASKVEGHSTLEEFKKQKEDRIKELEKEKKVVETPYKIGDYYDKSVNNLSESERQGYNKIETQEEVDILNKELVFDKINTIDTEINQLKQELERVETEGFGALKPIYNFYENTITNILNKTYGKENVKVITDEYGNTWNEITIEEDSSNSINFQPSVDNVQDYFDRPTVHEKSIMAEAEEGKILGEVKATDMLIQIKNSNHPLRPLASQLMFRLEMGNKYDDVPILLREGKPESYKIANYVYYPPHINMWKDVDYKKNDFMVVALHEILHAMSTKVLEDKNNENVKHFKTLMEEARKHFKAYDPKTNQGTYALYNQHEFLVALYTDSKFIVELSKIPPIASSEFRNLMEQIFNYLLDIIGIKKGDSLYAQAFAVSTHILQDQQFSNEAYVNYRTIKTKEEIAEIEDYMRDLEEFELSEAEKFEVREIFEKTQDLDNVFNMQPAIKSFDNIASYLTDLLDNVIDKHKRWKLSQVHNYGKPEYRKRNSEYFSIIEKLTNELANIDVTNKDATTSFIQSEIAYLSSIIDNIDSNIIASENLLERINFLSKNILGLDLNGAESDVMWDGTGITNYNDKVVAPLNALILKLRTYRSQMVDRLVQESPAFSYMREDLTQQEFEALMKDYFEGSLKDINDFQRDFLGLNANDDTGFMALAYELYHKNILKNKTYTRDKVNKFIKLSDLLMEKGFSLDKFLEKDTDGIDTGNIINRFTSTYTNQALPKLYRLIKAYREEKDFKSAQKATAYRNIISWYKTYTNIIDYRKLSVMKSNYATHPEYGRHFTFSDAEINAYEAQLISEVGQDYFNSLVNTAIAKMEEFEMQHLNKLAANSQWTNVYVAENSPLVFAENYFGTTPFNPIALSPTFRRFNNSGFIEFIPKRFTTDPNGNTVDTGFYNNEFDEIESDATAYEYWKTLTELYQNYINPTYVEGGQDINLLSWAKIENTFADEIIKNRSNLKGISKAISDAWKDLWFDDTKSHDPEKIRTNYVDTTTSDIDKFVSAIINYSLDEINDLARKAGIKTMTLAEIQAQSQSKYAVVGYKRFIATKLAKKEVYKNKSKDLTKITHALVELANLQRARQDSVTMMDILYKQHMDIKDTKGQPRENSNSKFRSWIKTNIYNTVEGRDNKEGTTKRYSDFEKELMRILKELTNKIINSTEDAEFYLGAGVTLKRSSGTYLTTEKDPVTNAIVNTALTEDEFYDKLSEYIDAEMAKLGKNISLESVVNGIIKTSVLKTFIISPISGLFNRLEGKITNIINDITGRYWTPGNNSHSERFLALANMMKFAGDKISSLHKNHYLQLKTLQQLVDEFNILQDRKNELEKRDKESTYGKIKSKFNPYALAVDNPEFKNQVTIMLNILQDLMVKDNNGVEHKFFDPKTMGFTIYKPGTLEIKPEFAIYNQNWSTFNFNDTDVLDNDFFLYKERISSAVSELQGNYSNVDSVKIHQKKGVGGLRWGKILMLYMRWLPAHINQRFGKRNVDFIQGTQKQIGRFRGLLRNTGSAATYVGLSATILYGPGMAFLAGIPILATLGKMIYDKVVLKKTIDTQILNLKVTAGFMQEVLIKTFGVPTKFVYANKLSNKIDSIQNRKLASLSLSEQRALKAMAQDLAIQINILMFMLAIKTLLHGGSEGDDDDAQNMFQNFVDNQGNRLINNLAIWSNPAQIVSENTKFALFRTIQDVYKFGEDLWKMMAGDKIDRRRPLKTILRVQPVIPIPNVILNYVTKGEAPGFDGREYANRQWFDRYTKSEEWQQDNEYKHKRAAYKEAFKEDLLETLNQDNPELTEEEIEEIVDKQVNSRMRRQDMKKKKGETSEEALKRIDLEYKNKEEE